MVRGRTTVQHNGPMTHISSLASLHKNYCIQMVRPWLLLAALDCSSDLRHDLGDTMQEHFIELLRRKYEDCSDWWFTNLATLGIQEPLVIIIRSDGLWQMDEGHHRLAWALWHNIEDIPIIFDDSGADDDSHMGYVVSRANVDAMHSMIPADAELVNEIEEALVIPITDPLPEVKSTKAFIPPPRRGRHRAGGRHRLPVA